MWGGGFLIEGVIVHATIFFVVNDYEQTTNYDD